MKLAELFVAIAGDMRPLQRTLGNARTEVEACVRGAQKRLGMGPILTGAAAGATSTASLTSDGKWTPGL